jgi:hypothetical protein
MSRQRNKSVKKAQQKEIEPQRVSQEGVSPQAAGRENEPTAHRTPKETLPQGVQHYVLEQPIKTPSMRAKMVDIRENQPSMRAQCRRFLPVILLSVLGLAVVSAIMALLVELGSKVNEQQLSATASHSQHQQVVPQPAVDPSTPVPEVAAAPAAVTNESANSAAAAAAPAGEETAKVAFSPPVPAMEKAQAPQESAGEEKAGESPDKVAIEDIQIERDESKIVINLKMKNYQGRIDEGRIYGVFTLDSRKGDAVSYVGLPEKLKVDDLGNVITPDQGVKYRLAKYVHKKFEINSQDVAKHASSLKIIAQSKSGQIIARTIQL